MKYQNKYSKIIVEMVEFEEDGIKKMEYHWTNGNDDKIHYLTVEMWEDWVELTD